MKGKSIASGLLAIAAVIGVGVTAYFCAKETPEANEALDEEIARMENENKKEESDSEDTENDDADEKDELELGIMDMLKIKAPKYKKTLIAGGVTIVCIASGHLIQLMAVSSALGGMYYWQNRYHSLDDVIKKAKGTEVYKEIHSKIANDMKESGEAVKTKRNVFEKMSKKDGWFTVYEPESKQLIETNNERVLLARNYLLSAFGNGHFASINKVIQILGGKPDKMLNNVGWTADNSEQLEMIYFCGDQLVDLKVDIGRTDFNTEEDVLCIYYSVEPLAYDPTEWNEKRI